MSTAAVMLVKDEADIVGHTLDWLATQVDEVLVFDNLSTDGTYDLALGRPGVAVETDDERGYFQSRKTTAFAMRALEAGHQWVIPVDADEFWYAPDGRRLADYLAGMPPDVQVVRAELYNHIPTGVDPPASCGHCGGAGVERHEGDGGEAPCFSCDGLVEPNPLRRIGWRQRQRAPLGKVCARLRPDLTIEAGNHSARTSGAALAVPGLVIRHFSWRSPEQYVRKIRNGVAAYALTDLPPDVGLHWRMWENATDEEIVAHYWQWFHTDMPRKDGTLIYDPAPVVVSPS